VGRRSCRNRDLRGLIKKIPHTHHDELTVQGPTTITALLSTHNATPKQLTVDINTAMVAAATSISTAQVTNAKAIADAGVTLVTAIAAPSITLATALANAQKTYEIRIAEINNDKDVAGATYEQARITALDVSNGEFDGYYDGGCYYAGGSGYRGSGSWYNDISYFGSSYSAAESVTGEYQVSGTKHLYRYRTPFLHPTGKSSRNHFRIDRWESSR
jgi:hypothetical protein